MIFDLKNCLKPYINKAVIYAQVPPKVLFKRHPMTGRSHMTYAVFSDEPMQPPEPKFDHMDAPGVDIRAIPYCFVGGRSKFLRHLGIEMNAGDMSNAQAQILAVVGRLESEGVFSQLQNDCITERFTRFVCSVFFHLPSHGCAHPSLYLHCSRVQRSWLGLRHQ